MKDKNIAAMLAFFLGGFGVHQFYLNRPGMGVAHFAVLPIFSFRAWMVSWIVAWVTGFSLLSMPKKEFDKKYNKAFQEKWEEEKDSNTDFDRPYREKEYNKYKEERRGKQREYRSQKRYDYKKPKAKKRPKSNPYKTSGVEKFKDYDYEGAIADFIKSLEINPGDIATHFNIACAYSLNEEAEKAFEHLDKAVRLGFKDVKKIKEHDALAYLRIQDEFDEFEKNGFKLPAKNPQLDTPKEDLLSTSPDLLDQLKKLAELKEKGLLTEKEFAEQKQRLLK